MPRNESYKPQQSRVSLWPNDKKQRENDPDLTGTAQIIDEGTGEVVEYWANAWENDGEGNRPVLSISLKRKEGAPQQQRTTAAAPAKRYGTRPRPSNIETWEQKHGKPPTAPDDDEDLPF